MVDTKNGESYEGILEGCDNYMNLRLAQVTISSADGRFHSSKLTFIRGNNIKSIQFEESVLTAHEAELKKKCTISMILIWNRAGSYGSQSSTRS